MSTSFRISEIASRRLAERAAREGISSMTLLNRLIREGFDQLDHPGIVFHGPLNDRRAGLIAGPDIWEVVARLQELEGPLDLRIAMLSQRCDLQPRKIRIALEYARQHSVEIVERIARNRAAAASIRLAGVPSSRTEP